MKRHHILATAALVFAFAATPATAQNAFTNNVAGQQAQETNRFPNARAHPFNEATIGTHTPRFVIELLSVHADQETGITNLGDDEITVVMSTPDYWLATQRFEDFDNNETRLIPANQSCIYPARDADGFNRSWGCDINGAPWKNGISIEIREHEEPLFDPFDLEDLCILPQGIPNDLLAAPYQCAAEDTLIGNYTLDYDEASLREHLPVGGSLESEMTVGGPTTGIYTFRYRITRTYDIVDNQTPPSLSRN